MTDDFVLMSPFGGKPSRFADYPPERIARMGKFFRNGQFKQEVLQAYWLTGLSFLSQSSGRMSKSAVFRRRTGAYG